MLMEMSFSVEGQYTVTEGGIAMYLDPGFGSMLIQFVVAGIAVVGAYLFIIRSKIKMLFSRKKGASEETETPGEETTENEVDG